MKKTLKRVQELLTQAQTLLESIKLETVDISGYRLGDVTLYDDTYDAMPKDSGGCGGCAFQKDYDAVRCSGTSGGENACTSRGPFGQSVVFVKREVCK